ncbi:MAG: carboxypeptidase regulatory-like domain-containing protein [Bryobacteraceae bacterium]
MRIRLLSLLALCVSALFGQASDSIIVGTVADSTGAAIAGATVTATNRETGVKFTSVTNGAGEYRLNNVPVGRYNVSGSAPGFTAATTANLELQLNHTVSVNLILPVGTLSTTVEVTAAAAAIDTSTAQLQTTYDSKTAVDVPTAGLARVVNGAGIYNLSLLGAGVASSGGVGQGTGPSIAGQRPENNSFNIDGVLNDNHYQTGPQVYVSNEAVAQFNLVQNQFSAEFGGASGGVFNAVVKSGTNQIHGSLYEYFQNRNLNAVDALEVHQQIYSNPRFDSNRLGATVGGPIRKDKLFYFGNFEYSPLGQAAQPGQAVYAPTSAGYTALAGIPGLNATNLGIFQKYVPAASVGTGTIKVQNQNIPIGPLSFASPDYYNSYNAVAAVDWNISSRDQVRGRYLYNKTIGLDFFATLPVFFQQAPVVNNSVSISEFHNFSPTLENELRISYSRSNASTPAGNFQYPGLDMFPNISIDELNGLQIGPDPNAPSGNIENLAQLQENITKTWGTHTLKAGYSAVDVILSGFFVQRVRGDYDYASLQTFLLDQQPDGGSTAGVIGERSFGAANGVPFGHVEHAAFFNDDYRIRPNLTLNLGIRYEYSEVPVGSRAQRYSAIADVPGIIGFRAPRSTKNDWSPRIGFAYSPGRSGTWSIRGGISRSFDNSYVNLNQNASPAYYQSTADVDPNHPVPNFLANGGLTPAAAVGAPTTQSERAAIAAYTWDQRRPYAITGTLGVQHVFKNDYTVEARYVYTKGVHLWNQVRLNILSPVTATQNIPTYLSMPSLSTLAALPTTLGALQAIPSNYLAQYGFPNNLTGYNPWGNSRYNGLALQVNKRFSKNSSFIAAYTWSHNFDDSTATNFSTILSPRRPQDFQNLRAEWASSALDRRQRFTFTPVFDFKPFQNRNWMLKNVVGNWNISGTYTYQSPEFATIQSGVDSNLNHDPAADRAIVNPQGAAGIGSGVTGYNALGQPVDAGDPSIVAYVTNNPKARYIDAGLGAFATGGRNTFPLGHVNNFDVAFMKRVNLTERMRFDIGAQAFNLFNHAQFTGGYVSDVNPFGTNLIPRNFLVPSSSTFGQYDQYFSSNARNVQLVARFVF